MKSQHMMKLGAFVAASTMATSSAWAAGYAVTQMSARDTARGNSPTATTDDAAAVWFNPAGLTSVEGTNVQVTLHGIVPNGTFEGAGLPSTNPNYPNEVTGDANSSIVPVPALFAARQLSSKAYVGFGLYFPYGLGLKWNDPDQFVGRTIVREITLRTIFMTPTIALKLSDDFSVALGLSLVPATAKLSRTLGAADNGQVLFPADQYGSEGVVELGGTAFGVGATFGAQLKLLDHLRLGFTYRSAVELQASGEADFQLPEGVSPEVAANFPDQDITLELTLPHTFDLGVGWVQGGLKLDLSASLTLWNAFDALEIGFVTGRPSESTIAARNWRVSPIFRLGGEYALTDALDVRAGLNFDISPIPTETLDPTLPDRTRVNFALGAGYRFGVFRADVTYMGVVFMSRTVPAGESINFGTLESRYPGGITHVFGATLGVSI